MSKHTKLSNQQFRKKYHSKLVKRSQIFGKRLRANNHGVAKRWAHKLRTRTTH